MKTINNDIQFLEKQSVNIDSSIREWWKNYLINSKSRYEFTLNFISPNSSDKILEVGSIPGQFTYILSKRCGELIGIDINPARTKDFFERNQLNVLKYDIENEPLNFDSNTFDKIIFTEVLEHLRINPLFALSEISRVLKPGGELVLSTPNISILTKIEFLKGIGFQGDPVKEFKKLEEIGHMGHFRLFELSEIKSMLEFVNLRCEAITYYGSIPKGLTSAVLKILYGSKIKPILFLSAKK